MPRTIRYHLDEHIDFAVAEGLRRRGIDVTTTAEANLLGSGDPDQLSFAADNNRVIVWNDSDFLRLHNESVQHTGIVFCHQQSRSIGEMIRTLELIWEILEPEEMQNKIEFI